MKKYLLFLCMLLVAWVNAQGIKATIDKSTIKLGEPIHYTLVIDYQKGDKIILPTLQDSLSFHIEILSQKVDSITTKELKQLFQHIELTGYEVGQFTIPELSVQKNNEQLKTKAFQIEIQDVVVDTADARFYPIKDLMEEKYSTADYLNRYWIYGAVALALILIAVVLLVLYIRSKSTNLKGNNLLSPYEEIQADLKSLDAKKYLKRGEQKEYYTQLSSILRRYVGRIYNFSAMELLSEDVLKEVDVKEDILDEDKKQLRHFFFDADLVKFAKHRVDDESSTAYRQWIAEFAERVKPLDIPENEVEDKVTGEKYHKFDNS